MKKKFSNRFKKLLETSKEKDSLKFEDVISKVKKNCTTKFDESIDVSFSLNLKQKKNEFNLRTIVNLPNGNGKKIKVAVLCEENKVNEAKEAGAKISHRKLSDRKEALERFADAWIEIEDEAEGRRIRCCLTCGL